MCQWALIAAWLFIMLKFLLDKRELWASVMGVGIKKKKQQQKKKKKQTSMLHSHHSQVQLWVSEAAEEGKWSIRNGSPENMSV